MPYVKCLEEGRWCVNGEGRDVAKGDVVFFSDPRDAEHFVSAERGKIVPPPVDTDADADTDEGADAPENKQASAPETKPAPRSRKKSAAK